MNPLIQLCAALLGTMGFALLYNIRGIRFVFAALGGFISWLSFLLFSLGLQNEILCYFLVALLISAYSEIMARILKTPTTTFIIISLIPLIPGSSLYYTMTSAFSGEPATFLSKGAHTLGLAGALAAGIIIVCSAASFFVKRRK